MINDSGGCSTNVRGTEVLNLQSILEIVEYLSGICVFFQEKNFQEIITKAKNGFLVEKACLVFIPLLYQEVADAMAAVGNSAPLIY